MQVSFNTGTGAALCPVPVTAAWATRLADLQQGESAVIVEIDLPKDMALRLMEMGFLPGTSVEAARSAPGGDPRVFRIDGTEVALRRETASHVTVRR